MKNERFSVSGKTALITGASRGIGKRMAERFAESGANVAICSRRQEAVDQVASEINSGEQGSALAVECDIRDRAEVESLVDEVIDSFGRIDCLVNNAGTNFVSAFEDIDPEGWSEVIGVKLTGTYNCTQLAGERMHEEDNGGSIINVASVSGVRGSPQMAHYGAANAALINLTMTLGYEWAPRDIRVNCIAPGLVATPPIVRHRGIDPDEIDRQIVNRRVAVVDEVVDIAQFLASPASSYVVGKTIVADGRPDIHRSTDVLHPDV